MRQDAIAECYADLRLLIYKVTHNLARRYCVPFEELISEAHYSFIRAFDNYQPERFKKKASFSSFVYFALSCDLRTYLQKQRRHQGHLEINEEICGTEDPNQFLLKFEGHLEEDAKAIVHMVLDAPAELNALFCQHAVRNRCGLLRVLKDFLRDRGWTKDRIAIAFEEITVLLTRY